MARRQRSSCNCSKSSREVKIGVQKRAVGRPDKFSDSSLKVFLTAYAIYLKLLGRWTFSYSQRVEHVSKSFALYPAVAESSKCCAISCRHCSSHLWLSGQLCWNVVAILSIVSSMVSEFGTPLQVFTVANCFDFPASSGRQRTCRRVLHWTMFETHQDGYLFRSWPI